MEVMSNLKIEVNDDYTKCTLENGQSFIIDIEAAHAYNRVASFYFGEYAKLNIIGGEVDETEVLELA